MQLPQREGFHQNTEEIRQGAGSALHPESRYPHADAVCTKPRNSFSAFQQVSEQHRKGDLFSEKVKRSPFSSSDKVYHT
jgi:hypothetical protein